MKKIFRHLFVLLLIQLCIVSCAERNNYRYEEGIAWNTAYHITYESERDLSDSILLVLDEINNSLSPFNKESVVSKINDNRSADTDFHFQKVYSTSREINTKTDGAFDPTLAPLIRAWGFGQGHEVSANDTLRLDSMLSIVGITKTEIKDGKLFKKDPAVEFNFSAIAKGYGVDCIAKMLERNGVANYLVEVGGEIRVRGKNASGSKWGIGIDRPEENAAPGDIVQSLYIDSGAIATSGNYRNMQGAGKSRFGHTISPVTGRPVKTDVLSATIVAPTCIEADALATSCMVLGCERSLELCNSLKVGVMLIKSDMSVECNELFSRFMSR